MDSAQNTEWKAQNAQTLLWCCFCDARFKKPAHLSRHLDRYNVNWKLYWQLFYSRRSGRACVLCNILHADRKSLECHFKMVHCITGPCAKRESSPVVVTLDEATLEECQPEVSVKDGTLVEGYQQEHPSELCANNDQQKRQVLEMASIEAKEGKLVEGYQQEQPSRLCVNNDEQEREVLETASIEEVDVLFEINHADRASSETSSVATTESLHLALPSTSSGTEPLPSSDDEVQMLAGHVDKLPSACQASQVSMDGGIVIADGTDSTQLMTSSTVFTVLQSDDEVEEIDSCGVDLVPLPETGGVDSCDSAHAVPTTYAGSERCEDTGVLDLKDDTKLHPVENPQWTEVRSSTISIPQAASFPGEIRQIRPTAVVNPFGSHEEGCSTDASLDTCERNAHGLSLSTMVSIPRPFQATTSDRSLHVNSVSDTVVSRSGDAYPLNMPVSPVGTDSYPGSSASRWSIADCRPDCRTPPHTVSSVEESELDEKWSDETSSAVHRDVPDLSRLTPSKIAAFMNRDVFSEKHQSDLDRHFEEKALADSPLHISDEDPVQMYSDSNRDQSEDDTKGSEMSKRDDIPEVRPASASSVPPLSDFDECLLKSGLAVPASPSSSEESESLPCGLSIVNVESLMTKKLDTNVEIRETATVKESTRAKKKTGKPFREVRKRTTCETRSVRKRQPNETDRDLRTAKSSVVNQPESGRLKASPTGNKKARTEQKEQNPSDEMLHDTSGSQEVFKQPIWQCVGIIHPGSLVEVLTAGASRPSKARDSLDGMVMKVEDTEGSVRYFIHFPNMNAQHDRWVSKEDVIQVYRTEEELTQTVSPKLTTSTSPGQVKRRLAFEPAPEEGLSKRARVDGSSDTQPRTAESARLFPRRPHRRGVTGRVRATGRHRRSIDRHKKTSSVAMAPRLVPSRQQAKATHRAHAHKPPRLQRQFIGVTRAARTVHASTSDLASSSDGRALAASGADVELARGGSLVAENATGATANHDHSGEATTMMVTNDAQELDEPMSKTSNRQSSRSKQLRACSEGVSVVSEGEGASETRRGTERELPVDSVDSSALADSDSEANLGTSNNSGKNGTKKRKRIHIVAKEPPSGVAIRPVVGVMLDDFCPGTLVYVACKIEKNGWRRLYPARVKKMEKDLKYVRYLVHYLGKRTQFDEWISPDVVHSVMDVVDQNLNNNKLKATWLVPPSEDRPPNEVGGQPMKVPGPHVSISAHEPEESVRVTGPTPAGGIRKRGRKPLPRDPAYQEQTENAQGDRSSARRCAMRPMGRHRSSRSEKTTRVVQKPSHRRSPLDMLMEATVNQSLPKSDLETPPPSLLQEAPPPILIPETDLSVPPTTERDSATDGHGAGLQEGCVAQQTRWMKSRAAGWRAKVALQPANPPTVPPGPEGGSVLALTAGTDSCGTNAPGALNPTLSTGPSVSSTGRRPGRPAKKFRVVRPASLGSNPSAGPTVEAAGADEPATAQIAATDVTSITRRRGRPPNASRVARPASACSNPSSGPTVAAGVDVPSARKRPGRPPKKFMTATPASGGVVQFINPTVQSADTAIQSSDSAVSCGGSAVQPPGAAAQSRDSAVLSTGADVLSTGSAVSSVVAAVPSAVAAAPSAGSAASSATPSAGSAPTSVSSAVQLACTPVPPVGKRRGRPPNKFRANWFVPKGAGQCVGSIVQPTGSTDQSTDPALQHVDPARTLSSMSTLSSGSATPSAVPVAPSISKRSGQPAKKFRAAQPTLEEEQRPSSAATEAEKERRPRRSLRPTTPVTTPADPGTTAIQSTLPPASTAPNADPPVAAASTDDQRDCASNVSDPVPAVPTLPRTQKQLRRLKDGGVVYVVYEITQDGTKFTYPAKIMKVNKDLYYPRYLIHYLGWAHRYNEWIAEEVIHSIVDLSRLQSGVKSLKRRVVPPLGRHSQLAAYGRVRPCSVDLSVNNICFFSALRKERFSVNDHRIMALRAAVRAGGQDDGGMVIR